MSILWSIIKIKNRFTTECSVECAVDWFLRKCRLGIDKVVCQVDPSFHDFVRALNTDDDLSELESRGDKFTDGRQWQQDPMCFGIC